ncbi:MAG: hypothetical protein JNL32_08915, partial [Candidatus Kapabacteria bacterium]|nr:hypothetical protein [Candidatus Kapabacteria bacterium]
TIAHNSTSSTAGNRIDTMRGGNLTSDASGFAAMLRYNGRRSIWEVVTWHRAATGVTQSQTTVATNTAAATYDATTRNFINSNAVQLNNARADIAAIITALQQHRIL